MMFMVGVLMWKFCVMVGSVVVSMVVFICFMKIVYVMISEVMW